MDKTRKFGLIFLTRLALTVIDVDIKDEPAPTAGSFLVLCVFDRRMAADQVNVTLSLRYCYE